jgi:hypothetical protein
MQHLIHLLVIDILGLGIQQLGGLNGVYREGSEVMT